MRISLKAGINTATVAASAFLLAIGAASAADRSERANEGRAYLSLEFGGAKVAPRNLHYGLRVDQDRRFFADEAAQAPLMQFDFTARGMNDMRVNGLSVLKQSYRLRQAEEEATDEAPSDDGAEAGGEEEGFFESAWNGVTGFFGGLFGGGDEEEAPADEMAEAEEEAAPEEVAEGTFMGYNAVDWGLLAIGAVGVGFIASEVSNGDEDPTLVDSDGDGIADPPGGGGAGEPCIIPPNILDPDGTPNGCDPNAFSGRQSGGTSLAVDPRYQEWLDSGTGHMGDLGG